MNGFGISASSNFYRMMGCIVLLMVVIGMLFNPPNEAKALPDIDCVRWHLNNIGVARGFAPQWYQDAERFTAGLAMAIRQMSDPRLASVGRLVSMVRTATFNVPYYIEALRFCWR